jgi:GNAT superfamily N-acetyltransferase
MALRIVDVVDEPSFALVPPCADPGFDHRSCDYWEDADRGSRAARLSWLEATPDQQIPQAPASSPASGSFNPFAPDRSESEGSFNPFAAATDDLDDNPFAPRREPRQTIAAGGPRKLGLLARGQVVFGSYAKVGLADGDAVAYAQFGPLSAYPRALHLRELYPQLPQSPLPAVITCIATTRDARRRGHARALVAAVCEDLAGRGFSAVEAYPAMGEPADATSAANVEFWQRCGFDLAVPDERFPVVRRELG